MLLSGDIQSHPGPVSNSFLNVCAFNIRSVINPLHYIALADLTTTYIINVFALTETWISRKTTSADIFESIPHGVTLISAPCPVVTAQHFRLKNLVLFCLLPPSNHLKCLLSLLNYFVLIHHLSSTLLTCSV